MKSKLISLKCTIILIMCTITCSIHAQRVSLDSLDSTQLHQKMDEAVNRRDFGKHMVWVPPVLGVITGLGILFPEDESDSGFLQNLFDVLLFYTIAITGIPIMATGAVLWVTGSTRIKKIDIALKRFDLMPENSMALGVGITFNLQF